MHPFKVISWWDLKETPVLLYKVNTDPGQNQNFHCDMFTHILFEPLEKEGVTEQ